jgi:microcystin-dependent protein
MAQPSPFVRKYSFTNAFAASPTMTFPGSSLDLELNNVKGTTDEILQNLKLLQNDDGTVKNGSIGRNQLSVSLQTGFLPPTVWSPGAAYAASPASTVFVNNKFYSCLVSHTSSSSFAADLAAGDWTLIADLTSIPLTTASQVSITPAGGIVTADMQSAAYGLDTRIAANANALATLVSASITDTTATGRTLMTSVSTDAALASLNAWSTGDAKFTLKTVADTGWMMADDSTIGPTGSGATHTGTLYQPLFNLLFANIVDADAALLTSAGGATTRAAQGTTAAAWTNLCRMSIPKTLGRALGVAGSGSGLTARALGHVVGAETMTLATANLPPYTPGGTVSSPSQTAIMTTAGSRNVPNTGASYLGGDSSSISFSFAGTAQGGTSTPIDKMEPTTFLNLMIKL